MVIGDLKVGDKIIFSLHNIGRCVVKVDDEYFMFKDYSRDMYNEDEDYEDPRDQEFFNAVFANGDLPKSDVDKIIQKNDIKRATSEQIKSLIDNPDIEAPRTYYVPDEDLLISLFGPGDIYICEPSVLTAKASECVFIKDAYRINPKLQVDKVYDEFGNVYYEINVNSAYSNIIEFSTSEIFDLIGVELNDQKI